MTVLGLTGPTGAGKGTVAKVFETFYGIPSIDTDRVYHDLLVPPSACLNELVAAFGVDILTADGNLDRAVLSKIVFSDSSREKQTCLNRITHKYVLDRTAEILEAYRLDGLPAALVDAPLLYESGFDAKCDKVIAVLAPMELRKSRIIARDALSEERAMARLNIQKPDDFYTAKAEYVVINDGDQDALIEQVSRIVADLGVLVI